MKDKQQIEAHIETVLAALRQAEPAPGMEQRIITALYRQADEASVTPPWWVLSRLPHLAGYASIVAVAVLLSAGIYRKHAAASAKDHVALRLPTEAWPEKAAGSSPMNPDRAHGGLQPRAALTEAKAPSQAQHVSGPKAAAFSGNAPAATPAGHDPQTREASFPAEQAQQEQGFPAPPLPLTEQERLLIRLIHRDDPVQLAQLAPAAREHALQQDREQVREFFKPPPMLAANFKLEPYPTPGGTQ